MDIVKTGIETSESVSDTLDWKVEQLQEKGLPVEAGLADYIALAISNFDNRIAELREYKKLIDEQIRSLSDHKKDAMEEVAEWMQCKMGVDRLDGIAVSSITVKEPSVSITKKLVWDIDKEEAVEKGLAHYEEQIKEIPAGIKINKRRK